MDCQISLLIPTWNDISFNVDPEKETNHKVDYYLQLISVQSGQSNIKLQSGPLQWISVQSGAPNIIF